MSDETEPSQDQVVPKRDPHAGKYYDTQLYRWVPRRGLRSLGDPSTPGMPDTRERPDDPSAVGNGIAQIVPYGIPSKESVQRRKRGYVRRQPGGKGKPKTKKK